MPSSMTHTYFGLDVYKKLNKNYQLKLQNNLEYFKLFCQGSDPFMFYHFLIGKKAKKINKIQKNMHKYKTREFFITTIKYIHNKKLINDNSAMAYLYGHICHYYLDLYTHPFIYYKSGIFKWNDKNTYKYNGLHQRIEYGIDLYFINKNETISPNKFKVYEGIFKVDKFNNTIKELIDNTIGKVYSINNVSNIYEKSIWYMANFFKLANYDPNGLKLKLYKLIDKISPNYVIKVSELSFNNTYSQINDWLNIDKKTWYLPWDKNKNYKTSFIDLYNMALIDSIKTIETVTDMLETNKLDDKILFNLFKDLSYVTGIDCKKEVEFKYFEF